MVILNGLQSVFSIMLMIGTGYFLTKKGWFGEKDSRLFSRLVVNISLPCLAFSNMLSIFDREMLETAGMGLFVPIVTMLIGYGISIAVARLLNVPERRRGLFQSMFALSNTIFIGLPVNMALFGEKSVPYVLMYYAANTMIFWTIGVYGIRKKRSEGGRKVSFLETFSKLLSPPLISFLFSLMLVLMEIQPPKFILDTAQYMGNLTTPLSMLFIGMVIHSMDLKKFHFNLETNILLAGRFIISPLLVWIISLPFGMMPLMRNVFIMEAAMPAMTQTAIVAQAYDADVEYTTWIVGISTLISLIFIPLHRVFLEFI